MAPEEGPKYCTRCQGKLRMFATHGCFCEKHYIAYRKKEEEKKKRKKESNECARCKKPRVDGLVHCETHRNVGGWKKLGPELWKCGCGADSVTSKPMCQKCFDLDQRKSPIVVVKCQSCGGEMVKRDGVS